MGGAVADPVHVVLGLVVATKRRLHDVMRVSHFTVAIAYQPGTKRRRGAPRSEVRGSPFISVTRSTPGSRATAIGRLRSYGQGAAVHGSGVRAGEDDLARRGERRRALEERGQRRAGDLDDACASEAPRDPGHRRTDPGPAVARALQRRDAPRDRQPLQIVDLDDQLALDRTADPEPEHRDVDFGNREVLAHEGRATGPRRQAERRERDLRDDRLLLQDDQGVLLPGGEGCGHLHERTPSRGGKAPF
jgi:hypothetical protein